MSECPRSASARACRFFVIGRRAMTLTEVVVSTLLVGVVMTAALTSVGAASRSWIAAADGADAHALSKQLLDEIVSLPYTDPDQSPNFGTESSETPTPGVRTLLDDTDDYKDWTDTPPKDRAGTPLAGYTGWSRTADVEKVNPANYSVMPDNSADLGLRLVTVTVTTSSGRVTTLRAYRAEVGGSLQTQGVAQTLVTWVGVSLQAGPSTGVTGGVSLKNHAADQ